MIFKLGRVWMSTRLSTWRRSHCDDEAEVEKRSENQVSSKLAREQGQVLVNIIFLSNFEQVAWHANSCMMKTLIGKFVFVLVECQNKSFTAN